MLKKSLIFLITMVFVPLAFASNMQDEKITNLHYTQDVKQFYKLPAGKFTLLKITGYQQTEDYTCGPAAVMSLLHYYGRLTDAQMNKTTEQQIAKEMDTNADGGTTQEQIVTWLKQHNFNVSYGANGTIHMLQENLAKGIPTLVEWTDWGGHWVVVAGYNKVGKTYDDDKDTIFFADPAAHFDNVKSLNGLTVINPDRFNSMWFDILHPDAKGHIIHGIYIVATPKEKS